MSQENEGVTAEETNEPVESVSQEASAPISASEPNYEAFIKSDAFADVVNDAVQRASQSQRDRATAKNSTEIAEVKTSVDEVLGQWQSLQDDVGFSPEQARYIMNNPPTPIAKQVIAPEASVGTGEQVASLDYNKAFTDAGIDPNSPAAIQAAQRAGNDPVKLAFETGRLSNQSETPAPSAAGVVQSGGSTSASPPEDLETIGAELSEITDAAIRGDAKAIERRAELRAELNMLAPAQDVIASASNPQS